MNFGDMEIRLYDNNNIFKKYYNTQEFENFFTKVNSERFFSLFFVYKDDIRIWQEAIELFLEEHYAVVNIYRTVYIEGYIEIAWNDILIFFDFLLRYNVDETLLSKESIQYFNDVSNLIYKYGNKELIYRNANHVKLVIVFNEYLYF